MGVTPSWIEVRAAATGNAEPPTFERGRAFAFFRALGDDADSAATATAATAAAGLVFRRIRTISAVGGVEAKVDRRWRIVSSVVSGDILAARERGVDGVTG